jgi:hypothetical protein
VTRRALRDRAWLHPPAPAIFGHAGDLHREGIALGNLGPVLHQAGRFGQAITAHQDTAALVREDGNEHITRTAPGQPLDATRTAPQAGG